MRCKNRLFIEEILFKICYVLGVGLSIEDIVMNKKYEVFDFFRSIFLWGELDCKKVNI